MEWSRCSKACGGGTKVRQRNIHTPPRHGGKKCGPTRMVHGCNAVPCCYPHCPPDVAVRYHEQPQSHTKDPLRHPYHKVTVGVWMPPTGCHCDTANGHCNWKSLITRGPPSTWPARGGSHMFCRTKKPEKGTVSPPACKHGWTWCSHADMIPPSPRTSEEDTRLASSRLQESSFLWLQEGEW